jgi:hypothetical protein
MRDHRDLFIWFFTPVFSVLFFCLYEQRFPAPMESAGMALIVGSNLLLSLKTDDRLGYRTALISMMIMGVICVFEPVSSLDYYYEILAVLSIFTTITLNFMLERVSLRAEAELALLNSCWNALQKMGHAPRLTGLLMKFQCEHVPLRLAWLHRKIVQAGASDDLSAKVRELGLSRQRGLKLTNIFSLAASTIALVTISATSRPVGWQHDFFALLFVPSVIYAFAYLLDLNASRRHFPVMPVENGRTPLFVAITPYRFRYELRNSVWSAILITFLVLDFTVAFVAKHYGWLP